MSIGFFYNAKARKSNTDYIQAPIPGAISQNYVIFFLFYAKIANLPHLCTDIVCCRRNGCNIKHAQFDYLQMSLVKGYVDL